MDNKKGTPTNQSVEKALAILEYMAKTSEPQRVLDMAKGLGMNQSTLLRFLVTLQNCGYVDQEEETSRYYLTYKICSLGNHIVTHNGIRTIARPYMRQLSQMFGESCCLAVEANYKVVYIEIVEGSGLMLRSMQRIGNIAPMYCTGIGKLLLTNYSEAELDTIIEKEGMRRFTEYTLTSKYQLVQELEKVRREGVAYDNQECEIGARCIAGPVFDSSGKVIAGVSVTGPAGRLTDEFIQSRLATFKELLMEISERMGYVKGMPTGFQI